MSLNDFIVISKIGQGAYSSVHKVKRISDGNIYALKKVKINNLKQKEKENALNQVRLLASITSQNIIKYKEAFFDQKSSSLCIVIQYANEGDLQQLINKKKKDLTWIKEDEIWKIAKEIITGLNVLHEKNIIHRDIKCANIFISNGQYKIADLNVSKLLKKTLAYTQTGTPYYASPEVWQDKPYELKSDIWSFGCILYQACALKPPFTANSMDGLYKKVMKGVYPRIPALYSEKLQKFIGKCLQLNPTKRPNCKQLLKCFDQNEDYESIKPQTRSSINLLNTIKVPRNMNSWRNDLPKANYQDDTTTTYQSISDSLNACKKQDTKYGNISQHKLRQIVRDKQIENEIVLKKNSLKKMNPQTTNNQNYGIRQRIHSQAQNYHQVVDRKSLLPRIKIYSQPNDNRITQILAKMKQQQKKRYNYNKPVWWG